jgi:2,4-dienoyl-CoA reductase-like NADH-dependent reductase (Old Yellow Enzyme family)/thioredoxin reductase
MYLESGDRDHIPLIASIVDVIHKYGAKCFVQMTWATGAMDTPQVSKDVPHVIWGERQCREMDVDEIKSVIEDHIQAAVNVKDAGAEGVELPMTGSGLHTFTSELYNHRTDEYGGSMENRLRAVLEIVAGIKERCGEDFLVGICFNPDETPLGGQNLEHGVQEAKMLADSGNVDWLRITARGQKPQMTHFHYPSSYMPQGTALYAAAAVRESVDSIPIIGGAHMTSPEFSEQALAEGQCDMVWAARSYIVDPDWPTKAKNGQTEEIRNCIGDIEGCFLRSCYGMKVGCTCNHEVAQEKVSIEKAIQPRNIAIIGAGPAGLNAAYYAGLRGHNVTLLEKTGELGGHVYMEAQLPGLTDRVELPRWIDLQLSKMDNVEIKLNTEATAESILAMDADVVILTTGASYTPTGVNTQYMFPIPGYDANYVLTPEEVIREGKEVGDKVVIFDATGYVLGAGLAEKFAGEDKDVTIVAIDEVIARSTINLGLHKVLSLRLNGKADIIESSVVKAIDDHTVTIQNILNFNETEIDDVDTIVMVASRPSNDELYHQLKGKIEELYIVGDASDMTTNVFCTDNAAKAGKAIALKL